MKKHPAPGTKFQRPPPDSYPDQRGSKISNFNSQALTRRSQSKKLPSFKGGVDA